ncbi:MAG: hypothetical protein ACRC1K_08980 [Planctomycetia bacterium]
MPEENRDSARPAFDVDATLDALCDELHDELPHELHRWNDDGGIDPEVVAQAEAGDAAPTPEQLADEVVDALDDFLLNVWGALCGVYWNRPDLRDRMDQIQYDGTMAFARKQGYEADDREIGGAA